MYALKPSRLGPIVALAFLVMAMAWGAMALSRQGGVVAAVWPMDALVVAFCVRWVRDGSERVAAIGLSGLAMVAANLLWGSPFWLALVLPVFNVVNISLAAWLLRRSGPPVESPKAFAAFVAGPVLAAPLLTAAGAAAVFAFAVPGSNPVNIFLRWTFATGLGMAIVGSFALTVGRAGAKRMDRNAWLRFVGGQTVVLAGVCAILLLTSRPPLFMLGPFLVLGAMSHRELGGITAIVLTTAAAVVATMLGVGPATVAGIASVNTTVLMQVLLASMVFTVLPVSALLQRLEVAAAELDERRVKAEALNAVKTRLLAYVSHEIRSPLSGVTTLAALMRDGQLGELNAEQREVLDQISATGAEVDALARDLTDSAAIQSGKASVHLEEVEVGQAIGLAVSLARFRTAQHAAVLEAPDQPVHALKVVADPLRLRQILVNLLVNGAKYGGRPPVVRITARRTEGGRVRFEVSDNGRGIAPDQRAVLFGAFERLGQENSALEGAGLGLALSREMASLQNGVMGVADAELGGMCFWLELPLGKAQPESAAAAAA
ncbi:MAG TPA: ATP-binding protein [Caulobacteraceae bacterium]|jgi:signal transduction histidine kinase|nr:ATP-binding protein [Caulobacteraceae bacterium]